MAKCKYILKLPGGGLIELPASFETLDREKEITNLFSKYISETNADKKSEKFKELSDIIRDKVSKEINGNRLNSLIQKSETVDELYDSINAEIISLGSYDNIQQAIRNYIRPEKGKGKSQKANLDDLRAKLKQPHKANYFKNIGLVGVIGATSLKEERNRVSSKNEENKEFGFPTDITKNLSSFLNAIISKYPELRETNFLYGTQSAFTGRSWSEDDFVMYELGNDLSLFMSLLKREAVKIDESKLIPIIKRINEIIKFKKYGLIDVENFDIKAFFLGTVENNNIKISQFEDLLEKADSKEIAKEIDAILNLISNSINEESVNLYRAIKTLFWQWSPDSFGKNSLFKKLKEAEFVDKELKDERTYKTKLMPFFEMTDAVRNEYFSASEVLDGTDLYEDAIENITLYKDIVKFPEGKYGVYAIVSNIFKDGNKINIYGSYKNQFGEIEFVKHSFKMGEVVYRKREALIDPFIEDEIVMPNNGALVISKDNMNQRLVKQLVSKGDLVNGDLVLGIYPGYMYLQKPNKTRYKEFYKNVKSIYSRKASIELQKDKDVNPEKFVQVNNGQDLSIGDYFIFDNGKKKFYKRVLYADKNNVYSGVPDKNGEIIIKATKREGLQGLKNVIGELFPADVNKIRFELANIGRSKATMSSFSKNSKAKYGDYVHFSENGIEKFGKVLNNKKVLIYDGSLSKRIVRDVNDLVNATFFTNRDISNNYSLFNIRANHYKLEFKETPDPLDVEVRYVIPKSTDLKKLEFFTDGYANIGSYIEPNRITDEYIDITDKILQELGKDKGIKVFGKKESSESNKFNRNLESLIQINYFNKLDAETKKSLNVITAGTYFSLYREEDIDLNIYRIISVSDDVVTAQLNKTSPTGEILTTEVELSLSSILTTSDDKKERVGSIGRLYLIHGNTKIGAVLKEVNNLTNDSESRVATNKAINKLISKLKGHTKELGIKISLVPQEGNFSNKQKAKIQTNENGETEILINNSIGETEDVIHEFLHLFLTPLRYKYPEIYFDLISSVVKNEKLNVTDAEEEFVKFVASKMELQDDFIDNFEDLESFVTGLQTILTDVNKSFIINKEDNPITLLKTPLMDLFEIDKNDNSHPMYNLGMITTEPMMREWMKKNNITLNCI